MHRLLCLKIKRTWRIGEIPLTKRVSQKVKRFESWNVNFALWLITLVLSMVV